jgi:hypothetical protein
VEWKRNISLNLREDGDYISEMIPKAGVKSNEGRDGKRVDGDFFPIEDKHGQVVDYKYHHGKCWFCGSENVFIRDNDHICNGCSTVTNHRAQLNQDTKKKDPRSSKSMRSYIYRHNLMAK